LLVTFIGAALGRTQVVVAILFEDVRTLGNAKAEVGQSIPLGRPQAPSSGEINLRGECG
jgi:hypothetical protein